MAATRPIPVIQTEIEYAQQQLQALGYDAAVFTFDFGVPDKISGKDVIIGNTENQRQKTYHGADGTSWTSRFLDDVRGGQFGPAPKGVPRDTGSGLNA